jgi:hypothetical protein
MFDNFRKKTQPPAAPALVPLEQSSYDIAYFLLPRYVFGQIDRLIRQCIDTPTAAGPFFYVMACQAREVEPNIDRATEFKWHKGLFYESRQYLALEYPCPVPVDMDDSDPITLLQSGQKIVLAPHYSVILYGDDSEPVYYILGQAPIGGGTTVRQILDGGMNCNLGPGPSPTLDAFLGRIREIQARGNAETG